MTHFPYEKFLVSWIYSQPCP